MNRRAFVYNLGLGLAAGWAASRLAWPRWAKASNPPLSLALLADAHLPDGDQNRIEARALARAVAEIKALPKPPHLVLFAGDLAHDGNPHALALGQEILSDLPMPILAVRGEGDGNHKKSQAGGKFFIQGRFVYNCEGINLLGVDTIWQDTPEGPAFALGEDQTHWLGRVLSGLDPAKPLVVLSHAPLTPIFRPWGQWTVNSGPLLNQLSRFRKVLCLHGHVHHSGDFFRNRLATGKTSPPLAGGGWGEGEKTAILMENIFTPTPILPHQGGGRECSPFCLQHISLPATSWPLPEALAGTPRKLRPGIGPRGCGWGLLDPRGPAPRFYQVTWQA